MIAWNEQKRGGRIHLARRISKNNWSSACPVSSNSSTCLAKSCFDLQVDGEGNAMVAWLQTENDPSTSSYFNLCTNPERVMTLNVATISKENRLLDTTELLSIPNRGCDLSDYNLGFNTNVERDYIYPHRLAIDPEGNAVVVWVLNQSYGNTNTLQASTKTPLGKWTDPIDLTDSDGATKSDVHLIADRQGTFHLFWREGSRHRGQVKYRSLQL